MAPQLIFEFRQKQHILNCLSEARTHSIGLSAVPTDELISALDKTRLVMEAPVTHTRQLPLVIAAARRHVTNAERQTVAWIVGPDSISRQEMAHLVRVRLICAELLNLLSDALTGLKRSGGYA